MCYVAAETNVATSVVQGKVRVSASRVTYTKAVVRARATRIKRETEHTRQ